MSNQSIRSEFGTALAKVLMDDIQLQSSNYYYFLGKVDAWPTTDVAGNTAPALTFDQDKQVRDDIVFMQKISAADISLVAPRYTWTNGLVYDRWDDRLNMASLKYYVITSAFKVYKCLDNNAGAQSTVEPAFNSLAAQKTGDGYVWKYMYTIPTYKQNKFLNSSYIPVQKALGDTFYNKGTIEGVSVISGGTGYTVSGSSTSITVSGTTTGSGATFTKTVNTLTGAITGVTVTNGGTGYTKGVDLVMTTSSGTGATFTCTIVGGVIQNSVVITSAGIGYVAGDSLTAQVGGAVIVPVLSRTTTTTGFVGSIVGVQIINPGVGYVSAPTLTVAGTGGSGLYTGNANAILTAIYDTGSARGEIKRVVIQDPGKAYPNNTTSNSISVTGDGSGASLLPVIYNGSLVSVVVDAPGTAYTFANLALTGAGTGASMLVSFGVQDYVSDQAIVEQSSVKGAIHAIRVEVAGQSYSQASTVVTITGDGTGATAAATVVSGAITKITMNTFGSGYSYATVTITDSARVSGVGITDAVASIIRGPINGHGFDAIDELGANTLASSSTVKYVSPIDAISQQFRRYGIIRNPTLLVSGKQSRLSSELLCHTVSYTSSTLVTGDIDKVFIINGRRYRLVSFDSTAHTMNLQQLFENLTFPIGAATAEAGQGTTSTFATTYSLANPTINKYSGSLLFLSNDDPFTLSSTQGILLKSYIKL